MKKLILTFCIGFIFNTISAQDVETVDGFQKKVITITKANKAPKVDGKLDDEVWKNASIATGFTERRPENGKVVPNEFRTEVKIVYTDKGVYFGAKMYDPEPDKILKELTERDNVGNTDFFFVILNGYDDGQQALYFIVSAAGVQYDALATNNNEDSSYNGIWNSAVKLTDFGWTAEVMIPYRELRFPEKTIQQWGLQFEREIRRTRQRLSWNTVDNTKGSFLQYTGILRGIENIEPPVRLSFFPFIGLAYATAGGETETTITGGMDLKYGINDAFTLDATLIPDFGQTGFDNVVLNLGPFEQRFNEQRQFFVEGTELFSRGGLFFSRRIGNAPTGSVTLEENEEITERPNTVDLINSVKVSGRTNKGLGIGVLNAITEKTYAQIRNTVTRNTREELIEPFTNYNVLVFDQRLKNNSSIALVNTNTLRNGSFRDANVTGIYTSFNNKKNTYNYWASIEGSWVFNNDETIFGNEFSTGIANIAGKHRTRFAANIRTKDYNIDDLGFTGRTNFHNYSGFYGYRYLQPKGKLNELFLNFNLNFRRRFEPDLFRELQFNFNSRFVTTKFFSFGGGYETNFGGLNDIFEPRSEGRHLEIPGYHDVWGWISTDFRKKYALEFNMDWYKYNESGRYDYFINIFNRYRFSDKFNISLNTNISLFGNQQGFVDTLDEDIIIGNRDRFDVTNRLVSQYSFSDRTFLNLIFRHSYSNVDYDDFFSLQNDGSTILNTNYTENNDTTFNSWNIDLRFSWWVNRGSQLTLLYRNSIQNFENEANLSFGENFNRLFDSTIINQFLMRFVYFIDYNNIKSWFKKKGANSNTQPITYRNDRGKIVDYL